MTSGFGSIIGQEKAAGFLSVLLRKGAIPNALLLTGPEGTGKRSAAHIFAMAANCSGHGRNTPVPGDPSRPPSGEGVFPSEPCGVCRSCRKFESGNHPDIIRVDPDGRFTKIAQIRELRQTLAMKPYEARLRVVVVGQAHSMNAEASNALLKVLEEPPDRTLLILVALGTSDLLPTIVSRCRHVRFRPVPPKVLAEALRREKGIGGDEALVLATLANGSFAKALALKKTGWVARRNWLVRELTSLDRRPAAAVLALAEKLAKNKDDAVEALEIVKTWFRDLIVFTYRPDKILNADLSQKLGCMASKRTVRDLLERIGAVERARRAVDSNANLRLILENLFLTLAEPARDHRINT